MTQQQIEDDDADDTMTYEWGKYIGKREKDDDIVFTTIKTYRD